MKSVPVSILEIFERIYPHATWDPYEGDVSFDTYPLPGVKNPRAAAKDNAIRESQAVWEESTGEEWRE